MGSFSKKNITVEVTVDLPVKEVWKLWTMPEHVIHWNFASDEWHTPSATNDLREGGKFIFRMEAKDGSVGFDFYGIYRRVVLNEFIEYVLGDDRRVCITFDDSGDHTRIMETFEAENLHSTEQQREGWQAILENFRRYAEGE